MTTAIDRVGAWKGNIVEHGVGSTKNDFPQFTCRVRATQKWVDDATEMAHFGLTEPGWVDWTPYDQEIVGYLVLFGNNKNGDGLKPLFNLENVQKATGWDGASFGALAAGDWSKKTVSFWTEENEYQGTTSIRLATIDAEDAPPVRGLHKLDAAGLKDLDAKFANHLKPKAKPVVVTAAPGKAPAKPALPTKPGAPTKPAPAAVKQPATPVAPASNTSVAKPASPSKPPALALYATPVLTKTEEPPFDPAIKDQETAWNHVMANKGDKSDDAVAEAWLAAGETFPGKDESNMTPVEFAALAKKTLEVLNA